ncbi:MAG: tetratricopeptide repeat protein [Cyanobacteria bacterium P01_A01_bin.114]
MKHTRWLDLTEYALLFGAGAGTLASVATQQLIFATAPLSALAAIGLVNRQRLEQQLAQESAQQDTRAQNLDQDLHRLRDEVAELPTVEVLTGVKRSMMTYSEQATARFSNALEQTRQQLEQQINDIDVPDLSLIYQDVVQLQDQYTYLCSNLNNLQSELDKLSGRSRIEANEAAIAQLKTETMQLRVNVEAARRDSKRSSGDLQARFQHVEQTLRKLLQQGNASLLKEDVHELMKAVSDMVPRPDFLALSEHFQTLREQHRQLRQQLETVGVGPAQEPLGTLPDFLDAAAVQAQIEQFQSRLDKTTEQIETVHQSMQGWLEQAPHTAHLGSEAQWLVDLPTSAPASDVSLAGAPGASGPDLPWRESGALAKASKSSSRKILEKALLEAKDRLLLVWPWADDIDLDADLINRFRQLLARNCQLDIGWCHLEAEQPGQLLRSIYQRWGKDTQQRQQLKTALQQLLPLKQDYPDQFRFKVLGTQENFLVCDRTFAVLGVQSLATQSSLFPHLKLRLQTTHRETIDALIQRFDQPAIAEHDTAAFFNRGLTRYDLRDQPGAIADYTHVLDIDPTQAAAYDYRSLAWAELGEPDKAISDLNQSVLLNRQVWTTYCNRGVLRLEQGDHPGAIVDLTESIRLNPGTVIPYFYRAQAMHRLGDEARAISDFNRVIKHCPHQAFPYCHRGVAYQKLGKGEQALADLEIAARLLKQQGDLKQLKQVLTILKGFKETEENRVAVRAIA